MFFESYVAWALALDSGVNAENVVVDDAAVYSGALGGGDADNVGLVENR